MYFGIALALMLSGASSANINDDNSVVNSNFLHRNRHDDAVSASSSISKKGRSFVVPSSNNLQETELLPSKTTHSVIGSRKIRNSLLENKDHKNKDKTDVLRVIYTADSKTFEVCNDVGLINSCSSAEEICIPLTEQRSLPFFPEDLVTNLTDEEMTELGVCLNLSLIQATNSLQHIGDDASAAATVEDLLYASDRSSIYMKEEDNDQRRGLQSNYDCDSIVCTARPTVTVSDEFDYHDFRDLIRDCFYSSDGCPANLQGVPLKCWNTAEVKNMRNAFSWLKNFNYPLRCWDTSKVTSMSGMFNGANIFNQPLDLWDVSKVTDMRGMFFFGEEFNQPMESWDVSKVTDMDYMFSDASNFDQPIDSWDVSNVTRMRYMFYGAFEFNQCLSTWADKTPNHVTTSNLFLGSDCPLQDDLVSSEGPWCQDSDICPASEPQDPCTNSEETFQITKKKSTTCMALESSKKARRKKICQQKAALESCPGICNMKCTCKDEKTFTFNQKKYKCKKAGRKGQPQCNDEVDEKNKVSDLCPKKCGTCYESE